MIVLAQREVASLLLRLAAREEDREVLALHLLGRLYPEQAEDGGGDVVVGAW